MTIFYPLKFCTIRPIVSCVTSPTHSLTKVLYNKLINIVPTPESHINNSFELKDKLKNFSILNNFLLSLDINALFTNVPCDLLVIVSLDKLYHKKLQFTYEEKMDSKINFLDLTLIRKNN